MVVINWNVGVQVTRCNTCELKPTLPLKLLQITVAMSFSSKENNINKKQGCFKAVTTL